MFLSNLSFQCPPVFSEIAYSSQLSGLFHLVNFLFSSHKELKCLNTSSHWAHLDKPKNSACPWFTPLQSLLHEALNWLLLLSVTIVQCYCTRVTITLGTTPVPGFHPGINIHPYVSVFLEVEPGNMDLWPLSSFLVRHKSRIILGWPKSLLRFFHYGRMFRFRKMLWKQNPNELFGQPNRCWVIEEVVGPWYLRCVAWCLAHSRHSVNNGIIWKNKWVMKAFILH